MICFLFFFQVDIIIWQLVEFKNVFLKYEGNNATADASISLTMEPKSAEHRLSFSGNFRSAGHRFLSSLSWTWTVQIFIVSLLSSFWGVFLPFLCIRNPKICIRCIVSCVPCNQFKWQNLFAIYCLFSVHKSFLQSLFSICFILIFWRPIVEFVFQEHINLFSLCIAGRCLISHLQVI